MEGPTISNNILRLSADMKNLRELDQQAAMVFNTEDGRFNILSLPCTVPAIDLVLSVLYGTRYRAPLVCFVCQSL